MNAALPLARPVNPHYERFGGRAAVDSLVRAFYRAMDTLPEASTIRAMHAPDLAETRAVLVAYLCEWMGGPKDYSSTRGAPMLRRRHQPFAIDAAARDAWMACMRQALAQTCPDEALRAELDAAFHKIGDFIRNTEGEGERRAHPGRPMAIAPHATPLTHASTASAEVEPPPPVSRPTTSSGAPMTLSIQDTAFARLEAEGRLLNSVLKAPTRTAGRFGFRGDIALKFQAKLADEARPPEVSTEQVIAVANAGEPHIAFLAGFLLSFESLKLVGEVFGELLAPQGKYFFFVDNIDISKKYSIDYAGTTFHILPIDEATVYNELLELLYLEKTELKKLDTAGKTDAVADKALAYTQSFTKISFEDCLKLAGPVRNPYENRPV